MKLIQKILGRFLVLVPLPRCHLAKVLVAAGAGGAGGGEGEEAEEEEGEGEGSLRGAKEGGKDTFSKEDTGKGMKDGWDKEEWMVEWEVEWEVDLVEVDRGNTRSRDTKVDTREVRPKE